MNNNYHYPSSSDIIRILSDLTVLMVWFNVVNQEGIDRAYVMNNNDSMVKSSSSSSIIMV